MFNAFVRHPLAATVALASLALGVAAPARAGQLAFAQFTTTSDFAGDVNPVAGNNFSVSFGPAVPTASVSSATGQFDTYLDAPQLQPITFIPNPVSFTFLGFQTPDIFTYTIDSDFTFDLHTLGDITIFIPEGTEFDGTFTFGGGVQFELAALPPAGVGDPIVTVGGISYRLNDDPSFDGFNELLDGTFQFADNADVGGGTYGVTVSITDNIIDIPEPSAVLAMLAVGGLGLVSRQKKQN